MEIEDKTNAKTLQLPRLHLRCLHSTSRISKKLSGKYFSSFRGNFISITYDDVADSIKSPSCKHSIAKCGRAENQISHHHESTVEFAVALCTIPSNMCLHDSIIHILIYRNFHPRLVRKISLAPQNGNSSI